MLGAVGEGAGGGLNNSIVTREAGGRANCYKVKRGCRFCTARPRAPPPTRRPFARPPSRQIVPALISRPLCLLSTIKTYFKLAYIAAASGVEKSNA